MTKAMMRLPLFTRLGIVCVLASVPATAILWTAANAQADEDSAAAVSKPQPLPQRVTFNAHIRPLMSNTCFACHGPDEEENESEFRIDSFASATGSLPSDDELVGIKPGDPEGSEVYRRIMGRGDGEKMPPEDFRHELSDYDKALFRKWIEQGAQYEQHWSYAPVQRPAVPELQSLRDQVANPIDAFVLSKLENAALQTADLADKATLLRRLSLDLIGLPPTREQLQAFLANESPDAYDDEVERLLASQHFGERMASNWLDLVRFADTVGFHGDQNLRNFAYRDYVIASFNNNKPFDQFTREQIAGDLLPDPTPEQLTATGVLRLNMVTREGGAQPGEYLAKYKADRVRMLGTAWLGSTLACCECHNHKYDPFTAKDFYSLGAFFDDLRQWGVYADYGYTPNPDLKGFNNDYPFPPEMRVESPSLRAEIVALQQERDSKLAEALGSDTLDTPRFAEWATSLADVLKKHPDGWVPTTITDASTSHQTDTQVLDDNSLLLTGEGHGKEVITVQAAVPGPTLVNSIRLEVLPDERNGGFVGRSDDGRFSVALSASLTHNTTSEPAPVPNRPRYVRIELSGAKKVLSLAEVEIFAKDANGELKNIATAGKARQSTNYSSGEAAVAIDGNTDGEYHRSRSVTHTSLDGSDPWWEVDLGAAQAVEKIVIWNRTDGNYQNRLDGFRLVLLNEQREQLYVATPATPKPRVEQSIPQQVTIDNSQPIQIAWTEADRSSPRRYRNGFPPLVEGERWYSGPARWQLPSDEARLPHTAVYHFANPITITPQDRLTVRLSSADVGRVRLSVTPVGHAIAGWPAASQELQTALQTTAEQRTAAMHNRLISAFSRSTVPFAQQHPVNRSYRDRILGLHSGLALTLVAQSVPEDQIPVSRVKRRGNWLDEEGELAPPAFPHFLPGGESQQRRLDRTDLADWLTSRDNPLTARHVVNRTWKQFFGMGLSGKLDDLGNQGEWPSHPQLLDWLAAEFMESGWDVKHLIRLMVHSRTYRQAAAVRDDLQDIDPYNRLLAQQSARRLDAELIRDNALAIAGLLNLDYVGGPSVYPYQPAGHYGNLQFPNRKYQASDDLRQYRRGVYMHWQRTFLHPMLVNFDAPSRDECTADRTLSNSPQQALTLLNDPSFVEAAHRFAARLVGEQPQPSFEGTLAQAFLLAVARQPQPQEQAALRELFDAQLKYFQEHPEDAQKQLAVGDQAPAGPADEATLAAWTQVCRVILNLHETITKY